MNKKQLSHLEKRLLEERARVMKEQKLPWTNVSDISGGASRYALAYNLSSVPSAFVIGGNGLAGTTVKDAKSLEEAVAKALK